MNHDNVKLNNSQKLVVLLKAINEHVPWQIVLIFVVGIVSAIVAFNFLTIAEMFWKVLASIGCGIGGFIASALTLCFIEESLIPLHKKIKDSFYQEENKMKKKILDAVIEDEILK